MLDCDADAADRVPPSCEHRNDGWAVGRVGEAPLRGRDARATERLRVGVGVFVDFF